MELNIKLKNMRYFLIVFVLISTQDFAQNTNPVVSNVAFSISGTTVTVTYDVADAEQPTVTIDMVVSSDLGATWDFNFGTANGDIGPGITIGTVKTITWNYSGGYNANFVIRIYANDETVNGTTCGNLYYEGGPNIDGGGAYYNTIQIGTQCWMKENLNNGTTIDTSLNQTNNSIVEKYCYENNSAYCTTWGGLYTWDETMQYVTTPGTKGICPTGWHIPTLEEFETLSIAVGGDGNALKTIGIGVNGGVGTNTSGFSALFSGFIDNFSESRNGGNSFYSWSSSERSSDSLPEYLRLDFDVSTIFQIWNLKEFGCSVRCLKD
jgi:uncharacterized protein (TIGR02145 family)